VGGFFERHPMKIFCDFDGTVAQNDVGDLVFQTFADSRWVEPVNAWKQGLISSKECLIRQCALARVTREQLGALADQQTLDPHFHLFVEHCRKRDHEITIVSDGLDFYIQRILVNHGLGDLEFRANHLIFDGAERIYPEFPYFELGCGVCGNCKGYHVRQARTDRQPIVYIGYGYSDRCGVKEADRVFAKSDLQRYCEEQGISYWPFRTFKEVLAKLLQLEKRL